MTAAVHAPPLRFPLVAPRKTVGFLKQILVLLLLSSYRMSYDVSVNDLSLVVSSYATRQQHYFSNYARRSIVHIIQIHIQDDRDSGGVNLTLARDKNIENNRNTYVNNYLFCLRALFGLPPFSSGSSSNLIQRNKFF